MAQFTVSGNKAVTGTGKSDFFIVDPEALGSATITDRGGAVDVLVVYDRPGRTAGEFFVRGDELIWRNYEGDEVRIQLNADGSSPIEFFEWQRLPEDGSPYIQRNKILLPGEEITSSNVTVALTSGADRLQAPDFATYQDGWSEVYGNAGNDTLIGTDDAYFILYGGRGNDLLVGRGNASDDMTGDAGNDILRGGGGDDDLDGGALNDRIFGGNGKDWIKGGSGDDELSGGKGADDFFFEAGETGADRITDYEAGVDRITLNNFEPSFVVLTQQGSDVLVQLDGATTILVENVLVTQVMLHFE